MRMKNYIDLIFFESYIEFIFLSSRGWKVNANEKLYRSYFFWELYRIYFFIISRVEGKCDRRIISILFFLRVIPNRISFFIISRVEGKCDRRIISILFFWELYRIEFLFLSSWGSYYLIFFESYIEFFFLSSREWKVNAIEELYR